jgi:peptidoglycan/LPS O-acetylase OafA/YrhL
MWSLATEAAFYILLPLIMWVALSRRRDGRPSRNRVGTVVVVLVVLNALWLLELAERLHTISPLTKLWVPSYLTWFAVGLVLASCQVRLREAGQHDAEGVQLMDRVGRLLEAMGRSPGVCWTAAAAVFTIATTPLAGPYSLSAPSLVEALNKNLLYAVTAGLLVLPCIFAPPVGRFMRVMALPPLRHLGHLSYGVFCVHLIVLELVARYRDMRLFEGRTLELFVLTLAISFLVSEVLYRLVERPALRLKNPRGPRRRRSVDTSTPSNTPSAATTSS